MSLNPKDKDYMKVKTFNELCEDVAFKKAVHKLEEKRKNPGDIKPGSLICIDGFVFTF